jgi:hypothetical protein
LQEAEADRPQSIAALRALLDGAAAPAGEAGSSGGEARSPAGEPTLIVAQASRLGPPAASAPVPDLVAFRGQRILAAEPSRAWRWSRHALYGAALVLVCAAGAAAFIDDHGWLPGAYQEATRKADAPREHRAAEAREESGTRTGGPATPQARRAARQMSAAERSSMAQLATFRRLVEARQRAAIAQRQRTAKAAPADRQPQAADQARGPEQKPAPAEESPRVQDPQRVEELGRSADDARRAADDARRAAEERMRIAAQGRHAVDAHVEGTARPPPLPPNRPPERQSDTSWPPALPGQGAPPPRRVQRDPLDPAIPGYGLRVPADGWRVQPYETY